MTSIANNALFHPNPHINQTLPLNSFKSRVVFVGGSRGTSPSLDLTFTPTGLSENLGGWKGEGRERGKGRVGETTCRTSPTGFCLKYHHVQILHFFSGGLYIAQILWLAGMNDYRVKFDSCPSNIEHI